MQTLNRSVIPHYHKTRLNLRRQKDYQKHRNRGNPEEKERNVLPPLKSDRRRDGRWPQMKNLLLVMMLAQNPLV